MMKNIVELKKETKIAVKIFYILTITMYFIALMTISCCVELFADTSTAFYWFSEIMNAANRVLFIGVVVSIAIEKIS